ncbi:hypothetical protein FNJ87_16805 [Nonlabens mediterrranea]|uniref:Uncharacterized protein n=1 Tax=Nonlabens mediterrranea TaxID=1419947 RepID=A0ABS0AAV6_9FLAO|nr:hypothetical protein [Nonlabens mediterrranea]
MYYREKSIIDREQRIFKKRVTLIIFVSLLIIKRYIMKNPVKSLFNLIEIFRKGAYKNQSPLIAEKHCENLSLHDYYCDQEHLSM